MTLEHLGWDEFFANAFEPHRDTGCFPARVAAQHRGGYVLLAEEREVRAVGRQSAIAAVGDWVAARDIEGDDKAVVEVVLPRRTAFSRKGAWLAVEEQIVAANVDTVLLVAGLDGDFNVRRLERYLTAAWESGAQPVVVLTKVDVAVDPDAAVAEAESVAFGVPVHAVSNVTGAGLDGLDAYLLPGRTVALLGSSGVGKSTLANRLLGEERLATGGLRADGRGRHTTTHRELVPLPGGALLLDTPGMRELQLWAGEESLESTFADVTELAAHCRFNDCEHETEPGCAVREALADGRLEPDRWESYRKLQRELRALEVRQDARLRSEARKEWRRREKSMRKASY